MFDGIDAGFRIFSAVFNLGIWALVTSLIATSPFRPPIWLVPCVVLGVILLGKVFFALWCVKAWLDERAWLKAEHPVLDTIPLKIVPVDRARHVG
jgi:hypothetical protein